MAESSSPAEPPRPVVAATRARQGRFGRPVFWVLVISTLLAAIALFIAWMEKAPGLAQPGSQQSVSTQAAASNFSAPEPAPVATPQAADQTPAPPPR